MFSDISRLPDSLTLSCFEVTVTGNQLKHTVTLNKITD